VLLWLLTAIGLAIAGNVLLAIAGPDPAGQSLAAMLIMAAFTAAGLFGLDPAGPRLMYAPAMSRPERLTPARLVFLGIAVAVSPALIGARELLRGGMAGLLLTVQAAFIAALVMVRIGLLAAERARAEQALEQQATHDPLTHLLNRREFVARLRQELARGTRCVLLFCDLDNFKAINDRYGHDTGDVVLIEVAARLRACLRPPALASRFGGDEFVIVLLDAGGDRTRATNECITAALEVPFEQAGGAVVGVSIGVAHSDGQTDPEQLIRLADQSMYRVKATHRGSSSPDRTLAA
jgi:diguanylate cyclase (GGDEF)-like protein